MEMRPHDDVWRTGKQFFKHPAIHTSKACVNGLPRIVPLFSAVQVCSFGPGRVGRRKPQPTQRRAPQDNISSVGSLSTGTEVFTSAACPQRHLWGHTGRMLSALPFHHYLPELIPSIVQLSSSRRSGAENEHVLKFKLWEPKALLEEW
ncbi:hypothetical protein SRHO_G00207990 [Serrasalmus rhombeus]